MTLALRRFPERITRRRQEPGGMNAFGEFIEGTITEVELPASVQPLDLQDADIAGGVSLVERLRIYVPEPDALRAAFDDAEADAVAWLGLEFTVEESRSWPGSHTPRDRAEGNLMRWPWSRREKRDSGGDFSDAVVRLIEAQAAGTAADASSTAAVEAAAGALSRAFAAADVVGAEWVREAVSPGVLGQIGRDLIRKGDSMHVVRVGGDGMVRLIPCSSWHWEGSHDPDVVDRPRDGLRARALRPHGTCPRRLSCSCGGDRDTGPALCRRPAPTILGTHNRSSRF